jgi:hypothetical protein
LLSNGTGPVVVTPYWTAVLPERKTLFPDALMQVSVAVPLPAWSRSPIRPPQPEVAPSGLEACQKLCALIGVGGLAGRLDQRADVEHHRQPAGVEQGDEREQARRKRVLAAAGQRGVGIEDGLGQRVATVGDRASEARIEIVGGLVVGGDRIGIIVAAEQEDADQSLIVGRGGGRGLADRCKVHHEGRGAAHDRDGGGALQEGAAGLVHAHAASLISAPDIRARPR